MFSSDVYFFRFTVCADGKQKKEKKREKRMKEAIAMPCTTCRLCCLEQEEPQGK
jgi:hypothetical protein